MTITATLALGCAVGPAKPSPDQAAADTASLAAVLPLLRELGVTEYRNQDWCKNLGYHRGNFTSNFETPTCSLFMEDRADFDNQAHADFEHVTQAMRATGVAVIWMDAASTWVHFNVEPRALGFQYWGYVYEPGYDLPGDLVGEQEHMRIDDDWYFVWTDWM